MDKKIKYIKMSILISIILVAVFTLVVRTIYDAAKMIFPSIILKD